MMQSALPGQPATPARAAAALRDAFIQLKTERQLRNRDVAQALGVSEARRSPRSSASTSCGSTRAFRRCSRKCRASAA